MITQKRLKELLQYSPETGVFTTKRISLGSFNSSEEARTAYLSAKEKAAHLGS